MQKIDLTRIPDKLPAWLIYLPLARPLRVTALSTGDAWWVAQVTNVDGKETFQIVLHPTLLDYFAWHDEPDETLFRRDAIMDWCQAHYAQREPISYERMVALKYDATHYIFNPITRTFLELRLAPDSYTAYSQDLIPRSVNNRRWRLKSLMTREAHTFDPKTNFNNFILVHKNCLTKGRKEVGRFGQFELSQFSGAGWAFCRFGRDTEMLPLECFINPEDIINPMVSMEVPCLDTQTIAMS